MRNILLVAGAAGILGIFSACGGGGHSAAIDDGPQTGGGKGNLGGSHSTAGSKNTAGKSGSATSDGGAGGDGSSSDPLAPVVTITSPTAASDPADGVLSGNSTTVTCEVTQSTATGATTVNTGSVKLAILGADGKVIEEKTGAPTKNESEYAIDFSLAKVPPGRIGFTCKAEDTEKHEGSDELRTFLDKGPTITFVKPEAKSAHALNEPLDIEFTVEAAPLADGDDAADVDQVSLNLGGKDIDLADAAESPGHYRLQVNLADPKLFNPAPSGPLPVTVDATNKRTPDPIKASSTLETSIDGAGPDIQITSPTNAAVVGGNVRLTFKVDDPISGVDPSSVVVSINMVETSYDATKDYWGLTGDTFTFEFDSRQVKNSKVQITVNIRAKDQVGNAAIVATELLYIDNYPPQVDLDPLNVRSINLQNECSISFDPVGDRALNDLAQVSVGGTLRAMVWEETNSTLPDIPVLHFSGTDQSKTSVYLGADPAMPLLVDTDGDGKCDDVANVDSKNLLQLLPIPKNGNPWFDVGDEAVAPAATLGGLNCKTKAGQPPQKLCQDLKSDMWQVVEHAIKEPVIYAPSVVAATQECTGAGWEFGTKLTKDGWVCFAARAVDNAGNVGISRPLRVCVDDTDRPGTPACANSSIDAPNCTDGCTPPPRFGNFGVELF